MGTKIMIISCVGQRATAVVTPINALLHTDLFSERKVTIVLLHTKVSEAVSDASAGWFKEKFSGTNCKLRPFEHYKALAEDLCKGGDLVYFNTNPGMSWQISLLCLYLPADKTICLSSDTEFLYAWKLGADIPEAKKLPLYDIGMDSYNRLSRTNVHEQGGLKGSLTPKMKKCLKDLKRNTSYQVSETGLSGALEAEANSRLVWARERKGHLRLLFDLNGSDTGFLRDHLRFLTEVYDPVNYCVTIASDNAPVIKRAKIEGVDFIDTRNASWERDVADWIGGKWTIVPKRITPLTSTTGTGSSKHLNTKAKALFVCLGDNIEPTLKAINSSTADAVCLFYDSTSPRIRHLAVKLTSCLSHSREILLRGTDHKGRGMIDAVEKLCAGRSCEFNITPGTKMQSVMLSAAAKKVGRGDSIYSILRDKIVRVDPPGESFAVIPPRVDELISCQILSKKGTGGDSYKGEFWKIILDGLARGTIKPSGHILGLMNSKGKKLCSKKGKDSVTLSLDKKTYRLGVSFLAKDQGGIWWEAVVARAVHDAVNEDVRWQLRWDWLKPRPDTFYSEFDVVSQFEGHIIAVSCKTKPAENLEMASYLIRSESSKRFGRFAIPFLAVPYETKDGLDIGGHIMGKVMVLTPRLLADKNALLKIMNYFIAQLSTTGGGR